MGNTRYIRYIQGVVIASLILHETAPAMCGHLLWRSRRNEPSVVCAAWEIGDGHFVVMEMNDDVYSFHSMRRSASAKPVLLFRNAACIAKTQNGVTIVTRANDKSTVASYQLAVEQIKTSRSVQLKLVSKVMTAWPVSAICEVQLGQQNAAALVCCVEESSTNAGNCGLLNRQSGSLSFFASSLDKGELMAASRRVLAVSDWSQIHVFNWDQALTPKVSRIDLPATRQITVSPDGKLVAVSRRVAGDNNIRVYSSLLGTLAKTFAVPGLQEINALEWTRDSKSLVVGTSRMLDKQSTAGAILLFRELNGPPVALATSSYGYRSVVSAGAAMIASRRSGEIELIELPVEIARSGR